MLHLQQEGRKHGKLFQVETDLICSAHSLQISTNIKADMSARQKLLRRQSRVESLAFMMDSHYKGLYFLTVCGTLRLKTCARGSVNRSAHAPLNSSKQPRLDILNIFQTNMQATSSNVMWSDTARLTSARMYC